MGRYIDKRKLEASNFKIVNGLILRYTTVLQPKFIKLISVQNVIQGGGFDEGEFLDSVNFLAEEGYIHLRQIGTRNKVNLADVDYRDVETNIANKGTRLLKGGISDEMIEV